MTFQFKSKALNFKIFNFEFENPIEIKYDFAVYSKRVGNKFFRPEGIRPI